MLFTGAPKNTRRKAKYHKIFEVMPSIHYGESTIIRIPKPKRDYVI